jgi:hypothetical protein
MTSRNFWHPLDHWPIVTLLSTKPTILSSDLDVIYGRPQAVFARTNFLLLNLCILHIGPTFKCNLLITYAIYVLYHGSISSTFYARIFCTKIFWAVFFWLEFVLGTNFHTKNAYVRCWWNWPHVHQKSAVAKAAQLLKSGVKIDLSFSP